jgi:hypothetical protein
MFLNKNLLQFHHLHQQQHLLRLRVQPLLKQLRNKLQKHPRQLLKSHLLQPKPKLKKLHKQRPRVRNQVHLQAPQRQLPNRQAQIYKPLQLNRLQVSNLQQKVKQALHPIRECNRPAAKHPNMRSNILYFRLLIANLGSFLCLGMLSFWLK